MRCSTEYHIIKKGYIELLNEEDFICYGKKNCIIDQITIKKSDKYYISFPMENSTFNYTTSFNNETDLNNYIKTYI